MDRARAASTPAEAVRITLERRLNVPADQAWAAVSQPALVSRWFTDCTALSARRFALRFTGQDGDYVKTAELVALRRGIDRDRYAIVLHDPGYPDSELEVQVSATGPRSSTVLLVHHEPPPELVEGYRTGWRDYLDALTQLLTSTGVAGAPLGTARLKGADGNDP